MKNRLACGLLPVEKLHSIWQAEEILMDGPGYGSTASSAGTSSPKFPAEEIEIIEQERSPKSKRREGRILTDPQQPILGTEQRFLADHTTPGYASILNPRGEITTRSVFGTNHRSGMNHPDRVGEFPFSGRLALQSG
jgi:hypothetical protein